MSDHLPECTLPKGHGDCICGELRAAEQRVTSDFAKYLRHMEEWQAGYNKGHAAGVEQGQRDERERWEAEGPWFKSVVHQCCEDKETAYAKGRADERHRLICGEDVMPSDCACLAEGYAKGRAEVVTVNLEGDFNYVKGYNDGLVEGDAKGRREGERIGQERVLIAWKEAEPLHDAEVRADEREKAIERVEAWLDRDEWGEAEFVRSAVIDALRGESNG